MTKKGQDAEAAAYEPPAFLEALQKKYPDVRYYLDIEDTAISYPVVSTEDGYDYYLHRGLNRERSYPGCIFADHEQFAAHSALLCIYGHNMRNGSMLHDLRYFLDGEYLAKYREAGKIIRLTGSEEELLLEPVCCYSAPPADGFLELPATESEAGALLSRLTGQKLPAARYVVLITCASGSSKRTYLVCRVKEAA